jgi:hypothetical protein
MNRLAAAVCVWTAAVAFSAGPDIRRYRETTGKAVTETTVTILGDTTVRCDGAPPGDCERTVTDASGATIEWTATRTADRLVLAAHRTGDVIEVSGARRGRPFTKRLGIDGKPWFQLFPLHLERRLAGPEPEWRFWVVDAVHMRAATLLATRQGRETVRVGGRDVETLNVHVALKGFFMPTWLTDYWYDAASGKLVRREGPGLPWLAASDLELE